ncbi:methyl-accepting chemotaxis protein [Domibacillus sp. PGB-M46]|uniref:methyl-accepting chemotaxis protein n=1 Tax=Domibacillus sp. PGB-M46 TaxID=2910255 RepID=UPI001F55EE57|nr:methyl-accepting chemotaxis protein [Domibacillus sp. PGB-M46]MCI2255557.1 methyl-accepting chemotaxis protein [Domibacillus sp. PGB-M46]
MKSIRGKLFLGFGTVIILVVLMGLIIHNVVSELNDDIEEVTGDFVLITHIEQMNSNISQRMSLVKSLILHNDESSLDLYAEYAKENKEIQDNIEKVSDISNKEFLDDLIDQSTVWGREIDNTIISAFQNGQQEEALNKLRESSEPEAQAIIAGFKTYSEEIIKETQADKIEMEGDGRYIEKVIAISVMSVIILAILISYIMSQLIVKPILQVVNVHQELSKGNLKVEKLSIKSQDEVGVLVRSVNEMAEKLRSLIKILKNSSEEIAASSEELSASVDSVESSAKNITNSTEYISDSSEEHMKQIQEVAAAIEQISANTQQIAGNTIELKALASKATGSSLEGEQTVNDLAAKMNDIHKVVLNISQSIKRLHTRSSEIGNISGIISSISNQTNLLALNAAIEAARAGESGKGFAVVADEVRKLAAESNQSAAQISELIGSIQEEVDYANQVIKEGTNQVEDGLERSREAESRFIDIKESIQHVFVNIEAVAATIEQVASGGNAIVSTVDQTKDSIKMNVEQTETNLSSVEEQLSVISELNLSARSLTDLAVELQDEVGKFTI